MARNRRSRRPIRRRTSKSTQLFQILVLLVALAFLLFFRGSMAQNMSLFVDSMGEDSSDLRPASQRGQERQDDDAPAK